MRTDDVSQAGRHRPLVPPDALREARRALRSQGWAVLRGLRLPDGSVPDEPTALEVASHFGEPSDRDGGQVVWRVTPASRDAAATFSVRAGGAGLHTDAQYHAVPEDLVCLFGVRPAADGGLTQLLSACDAVTAVARHRDGARLLALLADAVWRWNPPGVFAADGRSPAPLAAVLPTDGTIRWRADNLDAGLQDACLRAADAVSRCLENAPEVVTLRLGSGDAVIIDNQRTLHGRTSFADPCRLLLRVRLWRL
jgi:alpha-ketoglutarate-dependent taurine dioxygenase